jgi:hypothetical protein
VHNKLGFNKHKKLRYGKHKKQAQGTKIKQIAARNSGSTALESQVEKSTRNYGYVRLNTCGRYKN